MRHLATYLILHNLSIHHAINMLSLNPLHCLTFQFLHQRHNVSVMHTDYWSNVLKLIRVSRSQIYAGHIFKVSENSVTTTSIGHGCKTLLGDWHQLFMPRPYIQPTGGPYVWIAYLCDPSLVKILFSSYTNCNWRFDNIVQKCSNIIWK